MQLQKIKLVAVAKCLIRVGGDVISLNFENHIHLILKLKDYKILCIQIVSIVYVPVSGYFKIAPCFVAFCTQLTHAFCAIIHHKYFLKGDICQTLFF